MFKKFIYWLYDNVEPFTSIKIRSWVEKDIGRRLSSGYFIKKIGLSDKGKLDKEFWRVWVCIAKEGVDLCTFGWIQYSDGMRCGGELEGEYIFCSAKSILDEANEILNNERD